MKNRGMNKSSDIMLLTLCGHCVRQFYDTPGYIVRRDNLNQDYKEPCCYCGNYRKGWDYRIANRAERKR